MITATCAFCKTVYRDLPEMTLNFGKPNVIGFLCKSCYKICVGALEGIYLPPQHMFYRVDTDAAKWLETDPCPQCGRAHL